MEVLKALFWMAIGGAITLLILRIMECEEEMENCGFHPGKGYGNYPQTYTIDIPYVDVTPQPRQTETFSRR